MSQMNRWNRCARTVLASAVGAGLISSAALGADFDTFVVATDLEAPTGISYTGVGPWVALSEVPTPGVFGNDGGMNRVSLLNLRTKEQKEISFGEPYPMNLALDDEPTNLYWTCQTAGVIFRRDNMGNKEMYLAGLDSPSGISAAGDTIYFTTIGDPGQFSKENKIWSYDGTDLVELTNGEPAPTDIAIGLDGSLYWTCKTVGVILRMDPDGNKTHLLDDLDNPVGLALDEVGNLYFTEVPTPGVGGKDGGRNKVWRYNLDNEVLDLVNEGDPEPTDITVTPDGEHIVWTCTAAGVVVVAQER